MLSFFTTETHHTFRVNNNDLSGPVDSLAGLTSLQFIDLSNNELTGSLMDAANLTKLKSFKVAGNKFMGGIPRSFANVTSLGMLVYPCLLPYSLHFAIHEPFISKRNLAPPME